MKISKGLLVMAIAIVTLASCSKDDVALDNGLVGTWVGSWGFDTEAPNIYERWEIKKNGDLRAYNDEGNLLASGSCKVDGLIFTAKYKATGSEADYSFDGLYHDALKEIVGTWGHESSHTDGGKFEMYKQ